ncbi:hypothetical protein [Achromobacter insuavis]|uniref:hypothetical protein n=1 Tax=Achromobacter insuavis TaxID=1287735 RepID=UPI001F13697C|nr:hypothetical protein [Achromobacter insuavis]
MTNHTNPNSAAQAATQHPIDEAIVILTEEADSLSECHTLKPGDWKGEPEAKARYDHVQAVVAALSKLRAPVADERAAVDPCGYVAVKVSAVDWLKDKFPALTIKAGLCERIGGRLYTITRLMRDHDAALASAPVAGHQPYPAMPEPDVNHPGEQEDGYSRAAVETAMRAAHDRGYSVGWDHGKEHASAPVAGEAVAWKIYDAALGKHILTENPKVADMLLREGGNTLRPLVYGDAAPQASTVAGEAQAANIKSRRPSGVLSMHGASLHMKPDGSGEIIVNEDDFTLEDDRDEGPDGPQGSVHWVARLPASEIAALRNFLTGHARPSDDALWDQTLAERDEYHDVADKLANAIADHLLIEIGEHSSSNCPWMRALEAIENAAPRASAEDARDAALEEAATVAENSYADAHIRIRALKQPQADKGAAPCTCPSGDGSLRHPCPMHPGADKDGGQQRAGDAVAAEALAHLRTIANFGGTLDQAKELAARGVWRCAALSATQAEQGERDAD